MPKSSGKTTKTSKRDIKKNPTPVQKKSVTKRGNSVKKSPKASATIGRNYNTQNANNGQINNATIRPIEESAIQKLISKNKFPLQGSIIKTKKEIDGSGMVIGILDTGVFEHDDLKGKIVSKINFNGNTEYVEDRQGHGTHIAGIIAGSESKKVKQIKGIAPGAKIVSVKITLGENDETALWHIADGLERIRDHNKKKKQKYKVTAIVICFNAFDNVDRYVVTQHHRIARLIKEFYVQNIPVICSSGNNYDQFQNINGLAYPAYLQHVIACAATYNDATEKKLGEYTEFSQRINPGNTIFNNYFLNAPGYNTISTGIESKTSYTSISGSSQAAAIIAGTILLIQQQFYLTKKKMPTVNEIVEQLKK